MSKTAYTVAAPQERELSAMQRQHLTALIAAMNVAQGRLDATRSVTEATLAAAQKEFDQARDSAHAFLNYCATELGVSFTSGEWNFDQAQMVFLPVAKPVEATQREFDEAITVNGSVT